MRNIKIILILSTLIFLVSTIFVFRGNFFKLNISTEGSYIIQVDKGNNIRTVFSKLNQDGVYKKSFISFLLIHLFVRNAQINAGEYEALKEDDIFDLLFKIKNAKYYYRKITFIEGETIATYLNQINSAYGLFEEPTIALKEGYFMPGTYFYLYGETKNSILKRANKDMIDFVGLEFSKILDKESFYLKNIDEVLTLASVVEKETSIEEERSLIAGVFYNRLQKKMRLQSDPTAVYELTRGKFKLERTLTYKDLSIKGDYNTYRIGGLPLHPIASPGKKSIMAVLYPVKTDKIFFVADGKGGHIFTTTFEEHKNSVKNYRAILNGSNGAK